MDKETNLVIPIERIQRCIYLIRGQKVMLDRHLAELYEVPVKVLNQAVNRNIHRFPQDFMFTLSEQEAESLRSQIVTLKKGRGQHSKYLPHVFTEHGILMLSSVLNSERAVQVNIAIMRTFVKLREILADNAQLRHKIEAMERKYEEKFQVVFKVLTEMIEQDAKPRPRIGYLTEAKGHKGRAARKRK